MKRVVLIHGYSAESRRADEESIAGIYGELPSLLRQHYGTGVIEIDLSRYVSLNDAVTIEDIARALNRAFLEAYSYLLKEGFHVVIHSTGALVIRKWVQLFSDRPSPIRNLIYLAGANFGSGWALEGQGQLSRWYRYILGRGAQRGLKVLQALELGSSGTIDLHLWFTRKKNRMMEDFLIQEFVIIGTQAAPAWFTIPVRYAHEDGSDGVVRVSGTNLNWNHALLVPVAKAPVLEWGDIHDALEESDKGGAYPQYYEIKDARFAGRDAPKIPFGIVFQCAHSGRDMGIVSGREPRDQVQEMLRLALDTEERSFDAWQQAVAAFDQQTQITYARAKTMPKPGPFTFLVEPRNQYDAHAQVIVRLFDQDGFPIPIASASIRFVSNQEREGTIPIQSLIEEAVVARISPNVKVYYVRTNRFTRRDWVDELNRVQDFALEITAVEPATPAEDPLIAYLPLRMPLSNDRLRMFIQPHQTTILDVTLLRLPHPSIFSIVRYTGP